MAQNEDQEHDHGHDFVGIAESDDFAAYEETVHQVVTVEFLSRGFSIRLDREEALGLGEIMAQVVEHIRREPTGGGGRRRLPS